LTVGDEKKSTVRRRPSQQGGVKGRREILQRKMKIRTALAREWFTGIRGKGDLIFAGEGRTKKREITAIRKGEQSVSKDQVEG